MQMIKRFLLCSIFLVPLMSRVERSAAQGQPVVSSVAYNRVLDAIFPYERLRANVVQYQMVLRYTPSAQAECELIVNVYNNGHARVSFFEVSGSTAWDTANDYVRKNGSESVAQIAALVDVKKQEIDVPLSQAELWHRRLLLSLVETSRELQEESDEVQRSGEVTVSLDGTGYELWLFQNMTEIRWKVVDEELDDARTSGRFAVARSMNEVRRSVLSRDWK